MPQKTNLNISPYFDDYDNNKNFYKVLFKPGYPLQARELTTIQSILQNQVEQFGRHIFQDGSPVIDGQVSLDIPFTGIQVESQHNGLPILLYFGALLGKKLKGENSNVVAIVEDLVTNIDSENGNYTLYLKYLQSGGGDFTSRSFIDGENLILDDTSITYFGTTIQQGQTVCSTISSNSAANGSSVSVNEGIYFIRGFFAKVLKQRIFLDQYNTSPSYRIGFEIQESIITADDDDSLYDNAQGFSNYAAPGSDRFKINLVLSKRLLGDTDNTSFVELLRVVNGVPQFATKKTEYSVIRDEFARRLADQSGDFYVKPFSLFVRESLNDRVSSPTGVYFDDQVTINGLTPSEDKMVYEIGPGKAYVNGYDVETISPKLLDVPKPRTTKQTENEFIEFDCGDLLVVNNAYGSPPIGLGTTATISLMDSRIGSDPTVALGTTIGYARVYDFIPESSYENDSSRLYLRLFDIQTFTVLKLNTTITLSESTYIKGKRSNASGFLLRSVSSSDTLTIGEVSGSFIENEPIYINGDEDGRLIKSVSDYSISDIKSVYSKVGITTFSADLVLDKKSYISKPGTLFTISPSGVVSAGLGTNFIDKLSVGSIISYPNPNLGGSIVYNKVSSISAGGTNFTVSALETVSGVCSGNLPASTSVVTDILKIEPIINGEDTSLLSILNHINVSSINIEDNEISQRRVFENQSYSSGSMTINITEEDIYFDSFDEDRYLIAYSDGSLEKLTRDKFNLNSNGKQLTFNGLSKSGSGTANLIATVKNLRPNPKTKKLNKTSKLVVSYSKYPSSGIGTTTLNDGLTYSSIYGIRVQDEDIRLNVPDVLRVLAIFESSDTQDPKVPKIKLTSISGPTSTNSDFILGERIEGLRSGAVALIIDKIDTDSLEYVYLNSSNFVDNEIIEGKESNIQATILSRIVGSNNITSNFKFNNGQEDSYYDYSRIIRHKAAEEPKGKLKIIFQNYTIDSTDTGEFITVNSYPENSFKDDIPYHDGVKLSDCIDIRPRVSPYTLSSNSPFDFKSRIFSSEGQYSKYILAPGESIFASYSYYLPRIDKVSLNQDGTFDVLYGIPSDNPIVPESKANSFDIATISIPPYVYDVEDVVVSMIKHKRYRMSDIALLEDRIQRVEEFTVLSSAESKTENYKIKDAATGLDRFKCGFFVDNFLNYSGSDLKNTSYRCSIDPSSGVLRPLNYETTLDLELGSERIPGFTQTYDPNADRSYVTDLGSPGVKKSGDLITLAFSEVTYDQQLSASRTENVTAFLVSFYQGSIELNPSIDTWFDEKSVTNNSTIEIKKNIDHPDVTTTTVTSSSTNTSQPIVRSDAPITQTGVMPTLYTPSIGSRSIENNAASPTTKVTKDSVVSAKPTTPTTSPPPYVTSQVDKDKKRKNKNNKNKSGDPIGKIKDERDLNRKKKIQNRNFNFDLKPAVNPSTGIPPSKRIEKPKKISEYNGWHQAYSPVFKPIRKNDRKK